MSEPTIPIPRPASPHAFIGVAGSPPNDPGDKFVTFSIYPGTGAPTVSMTLTPPQARAFGQSLLAAADRAAGRERHHRLHRVRPW